MSDNSKDVLIFTDLSVVGGCSASSMSNILATLGHSAHILPTAILSTHTLGFGKPAIINIDSFLAEAVEHYRVQNLRFDAVCIGWLGGNGTRDICLKLLQNNQNAFVMLDTVMADNGKLYSNFDKGAVDIMLDLCKYADLITPNLTEALLLLGEPVTEQIIGEPVTVEQIGQIADRLSRLCKGMVVVKGVNIADEGRCNVCFDRAKNSLNIVKYEQIDVSFPGTGDIFSAVLVGKLLGGGSLFDAVKASTEFMSYVVKYSVDNNSEVRFGVKLEKCLDKLKI